MTKKIRVAIIDDDQTAIDFLTEYVSKTAGLVKAFDELDPNKGLAKLMNGSVDLLIVDMEMNALSGMELIAQIKELQRPSRKSRFGMQVIICSGHDQYAASSYQYDVTDYLPKPLAYGRFVEAIDCILWFANDVQVVVGKPMSYVLEWLPREHFMQCHRSYVINTNYVMDIFEKEITMRYLSQKVAVGDRRNYHEFNLWEMSNQFY
ncbi:hypothetical protein KO02_22220 [Sphingobacterium sp. ML3W]|uniref:LytR/AlgR family response regulator transcription factor n=1 Tax=Sphingobacterium sp. ML3W TaxID=1538644 RepID=UPI0004F812C3|nr:response regulator transcription factor [Sphingobacterium sp. ML3W]AIM39096.1 hypothetical protein KO02_22220 [Sphingobacterium sp. ML3W]